VVTTEVKYFNTDDDDDDDDDDDKNNLAHYNDNE
jgi:hypothetical protein